MINTNVWFIQKGEKLEGVIVKVEGRLFHIKTAKGIYVIEKSNVVISPK